MIKIKKSIGDKLLSVTLELPPLGEKVDLTNIRINPDRFLQGKWTTLTAPDSFSLCQEVTDAERAVFTDAITASEYSHEEVQKMGSDEFHKFIAGTNKIDWIPATRNVLTWIAVLSRKPPKEELDILRRARMPNAERGRMSLKEIEIPDDIKKIYTHEKTHKKSIVEPDSETKERLNYVQDFLDAFFINSINKTPNDAWEAMKKDNSGNIIIKEIELPGETIIRYRTKRPNDEKIDGYNKLAKKKYTKIEILKLAHASQLKIKKRYHQKEEGNSINEKPVPL